MYCQAEIVSAFEGKKMFVSSVMQKYYPSFSHLKSNDAK
jgi:hypothetical protein